MLASDTLFVASREQGKGYILDLDLDCIVLQDAF